MNLSGGETQQFLLARALYKDASFVILDEPTAALDPIAEAEIYAVFHEGRRRAICNKVKWSGRRKSRNDKLRGG